MEPLSHNQWESQVVNMESLSHNQWESQVVNFGFSSVQFYRSVVSCSLRPHALQHTRPPCPSPTPRVHSVSCPSSQWCHPAISSSIVPFSSCPQSLPASESFPMSQLFTWGGQSTGVSASVLFLPKNTQDWSPLEWTRLDALVPSEVSRTMTRSPSPRSWRPDFPGAARSSRCCFCWLYRASPSSAAKNIICDLGVDCLVMSICRFVFCIVGKGCLLWPAHSFDKTLLTLLCFILCSVSTCKVWKKSCLIWKVQVKISMRSVIYQLDSS